MIKDSLKTTEERERNRMTKTDELECEKALNTGNLWFL